jgi:Ser/Thr protein kinase RdoA (MazF antagonist)
MSGPDPNPQPPGPAAVGSASWAGQSSNPPLHDPGSAMSGGGAPTGRPPRAKFEAGELAIVCSRYDIGAIESVREFRRGSGRAPKVVLKTERGRYMLKRRSLGKGAVARVAFSHAIQLHLAQRRFPLPALIATRVDEHTMLAIGDHIYELFEFIPGDPYDGSLDATADAGRALGFFHRLLGTFHSSAYTPPTGGYHDARGLDPHLDTIGQRLPDPATPGLLKRIRVSYADAARRVTELGYGSWPNQIIHGDWHPGNMLFKGSRVAAVIDYDTARVAPRILDIANGVLQFSISMKGPDPEQWPAGLDESRLKRFCRGYETVKDCVISTAELEALPWLMIEALIVEAAIPIAATGSFAGLSGVAFLRMVDAKAAWLQEHAHRLSSLISD